MPAATADTQPPNGPVVLTGTEPGHSNAPGSSTTTTPRAPMSTRAKSSFSLKVIKALMSRANPSRSKPDFVQLEVGCVNITSVTATITHINEEVRARWGPSYTVVSNDGVPIADTAGTRG